MSFNDISTQARAPARTGGPTASPALSNSADSRDRTLSDLLQQLQVNYDYYKLSLFIVIEYLVVLRKVAH